MNPGKSKNLIYADRIAASPVREEALDVMIPLLGEGFGNPQSVHMRGQKAAEVLGIAREQAAALVGAKPEEVVFTATGSEANNMAIKGIARGRREKSNRIVVSAIEHLSVLKPAMTLKKEGFELVTLPVDGDGLVMMDSLKEALEGGAALVSITQASTEIGTIEPIAELAALCREADVPVHTDAWGTAGNIAIDLETLNVHALTLAGQNFGGPPGAAALVIRRGVPLRPIVEGGVQERNLRAGQENIPAIAGMGAAAELAAGELDRRARDLAPIRDALISRLPAAIESVVVTGHPNRRLPNHASFCIEYIEGEAMLLLLDTRGIMASSGSACTSRALKGSHVLDALGLDAATAQGSIVFSLGMENSMEDIDFLISELQPIVSRLREMSPLYKKRK